MKLHTWTVYVHVNGVLGAVALQEEELGYDCGRRMVVDLSRQFRSGLLSCHTGVITQMMRSLSRRE